MEQFELLKLRDIFQIEIELKNTKYPFARTTFKALFEKLKEQIIDLDEKENKVEIFKEQLENLSNDHFAGKEQQKITMMYCKNQDEVNNYLVHFVNGCLCLLRNNEYVKIDSENLFKELFNGRTPNEDDLYLENIGFESLPERKGKSCLSCFTIHQNGKMYVHPYRQDTMQHTFTTNGKDVMCAGLLFIQNGKIAYINNRSGHYYSRPEHLQIFFDVLFKNTQGGNIKPYFSDDFDIFRRDFVGSPPDIIQNKKYGLNFYSFGKKDDVENSEKTRIRNEINQKYNLTDIKQHLTQ